MSIILLYIYIYIVLHFFFFLSCFNKAIPVQYLTKQDWQFYPLICCVLEQLFPPVLHRMQVVFKSFIFALLLVESHFIFCFFQNWPPLLFFHSFLFSFLLVRLRRGLLHFFTIMYGDTVGQDGVWVVAESGWTRITQKELSFTLLSYA